MQTLLDRLFREDETLHPKTVVGAAMAAYVLLLLARWAGFLGYLAVPIIICLLALVCYAALRFLLPLMDPRHADADRFAIWGGAVLFVFIGLDVFWIWFLPALALGGVLLWWRAPELLEVFPWFEPPGDTGLRG